MMEEVGNVAEKRKPGRYNDIYQALGAIEDGMSPSKAARLCRMFSGTLEALRHNINTCLSPDEEQMLVDYMFYRHARGFPVSEEILLSCVHKLVNDLGKMTPFEDNKPDGYWYTTFLRRHPEVSAILNDERNASLASATKQGLEAWFSKVQARLRGIENLSPSRIFSFSEFALFLCPKQDRVLVRRGSPLVSKFPPGHSNESITVVFTANASGTMLPPLCLHWYSNIKKVPSSIPLNSPHDYLIGSTSSGWLGDDVVDYATCLLEEWFKRNDVQLPVVIFMDASYMTLELSHFCEVSGIEPIALHSSPSLILHPVDAALSEPLQSAWLQKVTEWRNSTHEPSKRKLKREHIAPILKETLESIPNLSDILKNGFKVCGLSPFDAMAIDYHRLEDVENDAPLDYSIRVDRQVMNQCDCGRQMSQEEMLQICLAHLEGNMNPVDLAEFQDAVSNNSFRISNPLNEGLFRYWLRLKGFQAIVV